jgi:hypothetical protein
MADTEAVVARVLADSRVIADNQDHGAAAADFIRNARARNEQRTAADKDASLRAAAQRVFDSMGRSR